MCIRINNKLDNLESKAPKLTLCPCFISKHISFPKKFFILLLRLTKKIKNDLVEYKIQLV